MFKLAIVAATLLAVFGGGQPVFAQAAISEPGAYAFYHPDADVLNAGRPTVSDSANASASECDSRIDRQARVPQTLSRHHPPLFRCRREIDRLRGYHGPHKPSYRSVTPVDARRFPTFN